MADRDGERGGAAALSAAIEGDATRSALRRLISGFGWPYLVLRLGIADPEHAGPALTPRLAPRATVDTSRAQ